MQFFRIARDPQIMFFDVFQNTAPRTNPESTVAETFHVFDEFRRFSKIFKSPWACLREPFSTFVNFCLLAFENNHFWETLGGPTAAEARPVLNLKILRFFYQ